MMNDGVCRHKLGCTKSQRARVNAMRFDRTSAEERQVPSHADGGLRDLRQLRPVEVRSADGVLDLEIKEGVAAAALVVGNDSRAVERHRPRAAALEEEAPDPP